MEKKQHTTLDKSSAKVSLIFLRYVPVAMAGMMLAHTAFDFAGYDIEILHWLAGMRLPTALILIAVSKTYRFCRLHMAFTMYTTASSCLAHSRQWAGFFGTYIEIAIIILGAYLFMRLFTNLTRYQNDCKCEHF